MLVKAEVKGTFTLIKKIFYIIKKANKQVGIFEIFYSSHMFYLVYRRYFI